MVTGEHLISFCPIREVMVQGVPLGAGSSIWVPSWYLMHLCLLNGHWAGIRALGLTEWQPLKGLGHWLACSGRDSSASGVGACGTTVDSRCELWAFTGNSGMAGSGQLAREPEACAGPWRQEVRVPGQHNGSSSWKMPCSIFLTEVHGSYGCWDVCGKSCWWTLWNRLLESMPVKLWGPLLWKLWGICHYCGGCEVLSGKGRRVPSAEQATREMAASSTCYTADCGSSRSSSLS